LAADAVALVIDRLTATADDLRRYVDRLQATLDETIAIEQAKGMLSERHHVPLAQAAAALERAAAERGLPPGAAAREIVGRRRV
jgi:AmiR/NasT family two-component response regulator